jgi:hypothetical protein
MPPATERRRWSWPKRLLLLAALLLAAFFALRALLQPERLGAFLLQQARDATGLTLDTVAPAQLGLWPDLHLELGGLSARAAPGTAPLLEIERVDAVLPWSALRAPTLKLRSLRLHRVTLDLAALRTWLQQRGDAGPPAPLRLPQLESALALEDSRIVGAGWRIEAFEFALPQWRDGQATQLRTSGRLERDGATALPFALQVDTTPATGTDGLRLDPLQLSWRDPANAAPQLTLRGWIALPDAARLQLALEGELAQWPAAWPPLPLPGDDSDPVQLRLDYRGGFDLAGDAALVLTRDDERLDAQLAAGAIGTWLAGSDASWLPPLQGRIDATRLQFGSVELRGVQLRIDESESADAERAD